jgi:hypothetical protein
MIVQRLVLAEGLWTCPGCMATLESGGGEGAVLEHRDYCPEIPRGTEQSLVDKLRRNVREMQVVAERKNRELDALHMVWCDGGCAGGVHRWTDVKVTRELVETAERNTRRLKRWYRIAEFRMKLPGADAWMRRRQERIAAVTDLKLPAGELAVPGRGTGLPHLPVIRDPGTGPKRRGRAGGAGGA